MASIIILSGPVGAGKTTIARELVACSSGPIVNIEGDKFWSFLTKQDAAAGPRKSFGLIMRSMAAASIPFVKEGYEVILDFSIPPWFLDTIRKVASGRDLPVNYVIIKPSEAVCATRAASRAEGIIADYAHYQEFYADFNGWDHYTIADDACSAAEAASRIRQGLDAGQFRLS
jgi:chloramphenicol 3-O-phosphotransferase